MTSHSFASARRHRMRRLAAVPAVLASALTLLLAAAIALAPPAAAVDAAGAGTTPRTAATETSPVTFAVAPGSAGVVAADQPLLVSAAAQNPTDGTAAGGAVRVAISARPLPTRADVASWLSDAPSDAARTERPVGTGELGAVAPQGTATTTITVDAAAITGLAPGVYPLRAEYDAAQGTLSATSVIVVPGEPGPGALGVVVPITAPPISSGLLSAAELTTLTDTGGTLRQLLDAVSGSSAILAIDPAVVAAIRVLGTTAPAPATQWLADLMSLPNPRFALQFGDADVAVQIAGGLTTPLTVPSLDPSLATTGFPRATPAPTGTDGPGASTPTPDASGAPTGSATGDATQTGTRTGTDGDETTPTPTPIPTPDGAPTLPTREQLTDIGPTTGTVYWPAPGETGGETVTALAATGEAPITLVDSSAFATDSAASPAWASVDGAPVLVADAATSRALTSAATSANAGTTVGRAASLAAASAYARLAVAAAPDAPLLVALDRSVATAPDGVRTAVAAATRLAGRAAGDLATLTSGAPTPTTLRAAAVTPERLGDLAGLVGDESTLTGFASILADPAVLTAPERASVLQLLSVGWLDEHDRAADAIAAHRAQTRDTLAAVAIVPPTDITLAAGAAPLTFSVRNDLRWPVTVQLVATVGDPRMIVQNLTEVDAGASQITRVQVPVEARVGSGESSLRLQLRSATGIPVGDPVAVHVAVRAEWESVGLVVLSVLIAGMIAIGAVRTVRKYRRAREGRRPRVPDAAHAPSAADADQDVAEGTDGASPTEQKDADG